MRLKIHCVFVWMGIAAAIILLCFHLYLNERREVREMRREVGIWEKKTRNEGFDSVMTSDYEGRVGEEMALRKLSSVRLSDGREDDDGWVGNEKEGEEEVIDMIGLWEMEGDGEKEDSVVNDNDIQQQNHDSSQSLKETGLLNLTDQFSFKPSFSLPTPHATIPLPQLLECDWLNQLRTYLTSLPPHTQLITLVSSDYKYREVLLNWLLTAEVKQIKPLSNILVLSLDTSLYQLLRHRNIPCVHIPVSCLLHPSLKLTKHIAFTQVHIMRVLVMRILNHWGYDVANYDSDALILRNPEPHYERLNDRHMIGSVGHFPHEMDHDWGTAVCIGVVLIRASHQTELYWEAMSTITTDTTNDQGRLNLALVAMEMRWDNPHSNMAITTMTGEGRAGFRVAVLPLIYICRQSCSKKHIKDYYIWHKGGAQNRDGKKSYASQGGLWYLHSNWEQITKQSNNTGLKWLNEIANR